MVARAAAARDPGARCQRAAGQRQRDAVTGQRGDHRRLIAESEQAGRVAPARGMDISVRQAGNRERPIEQCSVRRRAARADGDIHPSARPAGCSIVRRRRAVLQRATARTTPPDPPPQAAIRHSRRRTGSARHGGAAPRRCEAAERVIHLQSHQAGAAIGSSRTAQLVLARGEEHGIGDQSTKRTALQSQRLRGPVRLLRTRWPRSTVAPLACACRSSASSSARRDRPRAVNGSRVAALRFPCTRRTALIVDAADRSTPSVSIVAIASALRKSPHTLSAGPALRSISVTSRPARRNCDGGGGAGRTRRR